MHKTSNNSHVKLGCTEKRNSTLSKNPNMFGPTTDYTIKFAIAVATCATMLAPSLGRADQSAALTLGTVTHLPSKDFVRLHAEKGAEFLIGNSIKNPPYFHDNKIHYIVNGHTVMNGMSTSEDCYLSRWTSHQNPFCTKNADGSDNKECQVDPVVASKRALNSEAKVGEIIGYYDPDNHSGGPVPFYDRPIIKGNGTKCPIMGSESAGEPLTISTAETQRIPADISEKPYTGTPGDMIKHILVGNSVYWPPMGEATCGQRNYYSPDGKIYSFLCEISGTTLGSEIVSRWKMVKGDFCVPDAENDNKFTLCDTFALRASHPTNQGATVKVYVIKTGPNATLGDTDAPGTVMKGNPTGIIVSDKK